MTDAPRPGWYPDPAGAESPDPRSYRWWDGAEWTDQISDHADGIGVSPKRPRSRWRVGATAAVAFVLVVTASMGGLLWLGRDPAQSALGHNTARPTSEGTAPVGQLDLATRVARIGSVSMTMPAIPYDLTQDPMHLSGLLDVVFLSSAPVHPSYDGSHTWSSAVLFGRLSGTAQSTTDLEGKGNKVLRGLSRTMFDQHSTRIDHVQVTDQEVGGRPGLVVTAQVHYTIKHLPSRYDLVTAQLVRLDDDSVLIGLSSVPDDADADTVARAAESLASLRIE